jgi:RimJ/RimL family protein N-acetyltransferase
VPLAQIPSSAHDDLAMSATAHDTHPAAKIRPYWTGPRLRLRAMSVEDVDLWLAEEHDDHEAVHFLHYGTPLPTTRRDADAFAERYVDFANRRESIMWSIETHDGELVGGINLRSMDLKNGTFQTGTRIYRRHRGRGYGLEAKVMVLRYAFFELRYQKYEVRCLATNDPMVRHMARLGATLEGRIRRHVYTQGDYVDELAYGLTREEFEARLPELEGGPA